jgi:DNA mismatch repair protein MutL
MLQELLKTESLLIRVEAMLGREVVDHLQAIRFDENEIKMEGFTSLPSLAKGNRDGISIYIHCRYVKDRILHKAILEAYRHILPADKYPVSILLISLPPSSVDVNVHPTKAEVKFKEPERIYQAVWSSIRRALEEVTPHGKWDSPEKRKEVIREGELQTFLSFQNSRKPYSKAWGEEINPPKVGEGEGIEWGVEKRTPYRIVGQIWGTYILLETEGTLLFVDQHAAHERILYENLKREYEERSLATEKLLLPVLMELSLEESLILSSSEEAFEAIGFEIESVGERLYAIRSIPSFIKQKEAGERVREMLEELSLLKRGGEGLTPLHGLLISLACHSAVRANFPLRREEMEELIGNLYPFNPSTTCPHGRPIFFLYNLDELNKQFKRKPSS